MATIMRGHIRRELAATARTLARLRRDPLRMRPRWRTRHAGVMEELEAYWRRARADIDRLERSLGADAQAASQGFGHAWRQLKSRLREVCL